MELTSYQIIKEPVISSKSIDLFRRLGQLTFNVSVDANKIMVRKAVEKIWDVKVDKVRIMNRAGKNKLFGRKPFKSSDQKKAIVTLKKGYKIEIPGLFETAGHNQSESFGSGSDK